MMKKSGIQFVVVLTTLLLGVSAWGQAAKEFSAIIVQNTDGKIVRQKLFSGQGKIRIEPESAAPDAAILILDFSRGASYVLMPYQKKYVEVNAGESSAAGKMRFLNLTDPLHPCDALPQPGQSKLLCKEVGQTSVDGRPALQWVAKLPDGKNAYVWIDAKLGFPIKLEAPGNTVLIEGIREGAQDSILFEIPAGYTRLQLSSMEGTNKQSD